MDKMLELNTENSQHRDAVAAQRLANGEGLRSSKDRKLTREDLGSRTCATERRQSGEMGKSSRARTQQQASRELTHNETATLEQVRGGIRVGDGLQRLDESKLKQHLLHKTEHLIRWADFRAEVINLRRAQTTLNASAQPMGIGAYESKSKGQRLERKGQRQQ